MAKAHKFSVSHEEAFPNVLKSQETMDLMIPGRAGAALPAKLARACPRACRSFFTHTTPPFSDGPGVGDGTGALPPPVSASTSVEIAMPIAVRMLTMVMPCSFDLVEFRCRPFPSVFGTPWPSASRLRISGRRHLTASPGC